MTTQRRYTPERWNLISDLFSSVVDLSAGDRAARLAELTGDDKDLRNEVESLVAHDTHSIKPRTDSDRALAENQFAGHEVSRYRLLYPVAIARSSEVWCAEPLDDQTESDRVAVKFLRAETHVRSRTDRFQRESDLLGRFRHPNIAELLESGETATGIPYFIMPFVDGKPLTHAADARNLSVRNRIELMIRICDAVSYAHRFLVVHRDLKPSNILVGDDLQPTILDFGISKTVNAGVHGEDSTALLTTGERLMTPAYASPEQVHGDAVTTSTDLYALGLLLYELVSGHHAYSDAAHAGQGKLLDRISHLLPRKPSQVAMESATDFPSTGSSQPRSPRMLAAQRDASPSQLRRQLRGGVDAVVLRALAKQPLDRYPSLADFRSDLSNLLEGRPVTVRGGEDRWRRRIRQHPLIAVVGTWGLTLGIALAVCVGIFVWQRRSEQRETASFMNAAERLDAALARQQRSALAIRNAVLDPRAFEFPDDLSPAAEAFVARRLAEAGEFTRALARLEGSDSNDPAAWPADARLDLAAAYQALGRPTAGIQLLPPIDLAATSTRADAPWLRLRLLLDAGRIWEVDELPEPSAGSRRYTEMLLLAEYRQAIGWDEGAEDILDELESEARHLSTVEEMSYQLLRSPSGGWLQQAGPTVDGDAARLACRGRALLARAQHFAEAGQEEAARNGYRAVLELFADHLPDHFLAFTAMQCLADFKQRVGDDGYEDLRAAHWDRIVATQEFGTVSAAWTAVTILHARDVHERQRFLELIRKHHSDLTREPYLQSQLLRLEFQSELEVADLNKARRTLDELCELDAQLWGDASLEYTYALAARNHVRSELGEPDFEADRDAVKQNVARLRTTLPKAPAKAFLEPVVGVTGRSLPDYRWIRYFEMFRFNEPDEQRQMLMHISRELEDEHPEAAALLVAGLADG